MKNFGTSLMILMGLEIAINPILSQHSWLLFFGFLSFIFGLDLRYKKELQ